jgi:hypothetical protein
MSVDGQFPEIADLTPWTMPKRYGGLDSGESGYVESQARLAELAGKTLSYQDRNVLFRPR